MVNEKPLGVGTLYAGIKPMGIGSEQRTASRVIWGLGDTARELALLCSEKVESIKEKVGSVHYFAPEGDPFPEFRELVMRLAESSRIRGEDLELEVKIILASWEVPDTDTADLLATISQTLERILAVKRTLTLSVLIPPTTASVERLGWVFGNFLVLEKLLGTVTFLNSAFVYQLPSDMYGQPLRQASTTGDLVELIVREFADPDLRETIHQLVYPVLSQEQKAAGRKAVYSALGAQRLYYIKEDLQQQLETRFQRDLLHQGMLNPAAVSEIIRARTEKLANGCTADCRELISKHRETGPKPKSYHSAFSAADHTEWMTGQGFTTKLDAVVSLINAELEPLFNQLDQKLTQVFDDALAMEGQNLAYGRRYLELLEGGVEHDESDKRTPEAVGLYKLEQEFVLEPYFLSVIGFIRQMNSKFAVDSDVFQAKDQGRADPVKLLEASVEVLISALTNSDLKSPYLVRVLSSSWELMKINSQRSWCSQAEAQELFIQVFAVFGECFKELKHFVNENERKLQELEEQRQALQAVYPWYKRIFKEPEEYRKEKDEINILASDFAEEREQLDHTATAMEMPLRLLVEEVLLPHLIAVLVMDGLQALVQHQMNALDSFSQQLTTWCEKQSKEAKRITEQDGLTETRVLTRAKFDVLYDQQTVSRSWEEYTKQVMAFNPPTTGRANQDLPDYVNYRNLRDHYHAGVDGLTERISDFTAELFLPMKGLNALDIIEVDGNVSTRDLLKRLLAKTEYLPEFSSGMIPLAQQSGALKRIRIIRCVPEIQERFKADYSDLIDENDRFLDIEDDRVIDLSTLRFCFPAFLLHVLSAAHHEIQDEQDETAEDLWPE